MLFGYYLSRVGGMKINIAALLQRGFYMYSTRNMKTARVQTRSRAPVAEPTAPIPTFKSYNFHNKIYEFLEAKDFNTPSSIQMKFYESIINDKNHNYYIVGPTGSGKTLAYLLPVFNQLKKQEQQMGVILTKPNRPRCLIIVSSKELTVQVSEICKQISHFMKLKVGGLNIGETRKMQIKKLDSGLDIIVTTPDKFEQYKKWLFIGYANFLVVDEFDTLLDSNKGQQLKLLIEAMKSRQIKHSDFKGVVPKIIFISATYTKLMDEFFKANFTYYERHEKFYNKAELEAIKNLPAIQNPEEFSLKKVIDNNTHLNLQNIKHEFIHCSSLDKHEPLYSLLKQEKNKLNKTSVMIFCNTITSLHNLEYYLNQNKINVLTLHGNLPKQIRFANYEKFRERASNIILTTDLGSRGLDLDFVSHVINYDFPKSVSDYLHRAGRTGRAGKQGFVFTLYHNKNIDMINELKQSNDSKKPLSIKKSAYSLRNKQDLERQYHRKRKVTSRAVKK